MKELANFCKSLKKDFTPKIKDTRKPASFWNEKDVIDKKIVDAFVIILRTRGCSWAIKSGCSMCGYFNDSIWKKISDRDILSQIEYAMKNYSDQPFIKIFTSGSFLDDIEISKKLRKDILNILYKKCEKVSVESRPEFITDKKLSEIKEISGSKIFEIGIGLETVDDYIREHFINKGFTFKDYKKAANVVKKHGFNLKTYVLIKPPFLTEKQSIDDAVKTVDKIKEITDVISLNPCNVQRNTVVEYLWNRKEYRPPWLFSIVEILKQSSKITSDVLLKCDIAGGGSIRGAHNCKSCDNIFLKTIRSFSLNQDISVFNNVDCDCREKWLDQLDIENIGFGSLVNMYR